MDPTVVDLVLKDAADRTSTTPVLVSTDPAIWPDSALGLPEPGYGYLQVITPGMVVTVQAGDQQMVYHTDLATNFTLVTSS